MKRQLLLAALLLLATEMPVGALADGQVDNVVSEIGALTSDERTALIPRESSGVLSLIGMIAIPATPAVTQAETDLDALNADDKTAVVRWLKNSNDRTGMYALGYTDVELDQYNQQ